MPSDDPLTIRVQLIELDIDLRLGVGLFEAVASSRGDEALMLGYLRFAYGAGYRDALIDQPRGQLFRDHGFPVPKRKPR
jgi:hypothetical protein